MISFQLQHTNGLIDKTGVRHKPIALAAQQSAIYTCQPLA
jgi:hypothetical protein